MQYAILCLLFNSAIVASKIVNSGMILDDSFDDDSTGIWLSKCAIMLHMTTPPSVPHFATAFQYNMYWLSGAAASFWE